QPDWAPTAAYYAFQMFTHHFGEQLVRSSSDGPTYDSEAIGLVDAVKDVPYLDIVSSLSADRKDLYIVGINKHFDGSIEGSITLEGFDPRPNGTAWTLNGTGIDANTGTTPLRVPGLNWGNQVEDRQAPRFSKGGPAEINVSNSNFTVAGKRFTF